MLEFIMGGEATQAESIACLARYQKLDVSKPALARMSTLAEWDSNYNRANNAAQDIQDMIAQRDQQRRAGGGGSNSGIRPALNTLDRSLDKLDAALRQFEAAPPLGA